MSRSIALTSGDIALVDDEDYEWLSKYTWYLSEINNSKYAQTRVAGRTIFMHQLIMSDPPSNMTVDHINRDGLDNRRANLRFATKSQQAVNSRKREGTSKYRGVHWDGRARKWVAQIMMNGKNHFLGRFHNEEDAARAYDVAALKFFGEFAQLNFPLVSI